jgi:5-methylcytosine-specific restriction protein A
MKKQDVNLTLLDPLTRVLYENYEIAGRDLGFWAERFRQSLLKNGGLVVAKRILDKKKTGGLTKGFFAAKDAGRLDLSVEAIVLRPEFRPFFSKEELVTARKRLESYGFRPPKEVRLAIIYPDDVAEGPSYNEGAVAQVLVNRYERDARARAACLRKHKARCKVCDLQFVDLYGEIGKGFIHVHHVKPLGAIRKEYKLNPTVDLVPVCPNCHAMLHKRDPPFLIHELKALLRKDVAFQKDS